MVGCLRRKIASKSSSVVLFRNVSALSYTPVLESSLGAFALKTLQFRAMASQAFAFDPPPVPSIAITNPESSDSRDEKRFPVHRIYCVGRNYSDHVKEMGGDPKKSAPTFFTKPADAVVESPATIAYPMATENLHYEVELVVCMGKSGSQIPVDDALDYIFGYAVGIDLTRRDLQSAAKSKGLPWDSSKAFDQSAPISAIVPASASIHSAMECAKINLSVNDEIRQIATLDQMIWSTREIIHQLSTLFHLQPGDLIFTGTPSGVGPITAGDKIEATVEGLPKVKIVLTDGW